MAHLVYLVPLLPFIGFIITGLLSFFTKNKTSPIAGWIASAAVLGSFIVSVIIFFDLKSNEAQSTIIPLFEFINISQMRIPFAFQVDALSSVFMMVITGVGFLIHIYSIAYMGHDDGVIKFFSFLNLFVFSMLLLVLGANYLILFIGWEGVGFCSYLLIGFWYKNLDYTKAAQKAFVMNRIGDLGFLIGMFLIFSKFQTLDFIELQSIFSTGNIDSGFVTAVAICFFIGATGKSAQIPLFTWLPDAMAGPTPVSALIHAATMVTAGVYMIARSNFIYSLSPFAQQIILIIGLATALIAATIATRQNDIKKILAYSTVSQLGFMFIALGVGAYTAAVFHVITHAFFKALLFLGAGSVIHAMGGEQDITKMGGLSKKIKITYSTFLIGCIAIAGIPPLSGFFSKDEIMMHLFAHHTVGKIFWIVALFTALLTAYYMFRLLFKTFYGSFNGTEKQKAHLHESPLLMTIPLILLAALSVIGGLIGIPEILGGKHLLQKFLSPVFISSKSSIHLSHTTEYILIAIAVLTAIAGIVYAWFAFTKNTKTSQSKSATFFENKWYVDELYETIIVLPLKKISHFFENSIEKSGIDGAVNGIGKLIQTGSNKFRLLQNGFVGSYLFLMVIGIILLFIIQIIFNKN